MHFAALIPNNRKGHTHNQESNIEDNGLNIGSGKHADHVGSGCQKADPHNEGEDGPGHTEDGLLPLLGELVGQRSHEENKESRLSIGAQQSHVGHGRDVNAQEQGEHGDDIVDQQIFIGGLVLGMQVTQRLGQPAVVGQHDERFGHRANHAVERGCGGAQSTAYHKDNVFGSRQEVVGDDTQCLVGNLINGQDAGSHDTDKGKQDGNDDGGDCCSQRDVSLGVFASAEKTIRPVPPRRE